MTTIDYKIRSVDTARGSIVVDAGIYGVFNLDLPIDEDGNVPVGIELQRYINGFLPYGELQRQEQLTSAGINNIEQIERLVVPFDSQPEISLEDYKKEKKALINNARDVIETKGFNYNGHRFQSDQKSVSRLQVAALAAQAAIAAEQPYSIEWTTADNSVVTLDAMGVFSAISAFAGFAASIHETAKQVKAEIDAAADKDAVDAVEWP